MSAVDRVNRAIGELTFCPTGKVAYASEEHANQAARRQTQHPYLRAYHCNSDHGPSCGWWHLTKNPWRK